MDKKQAKQSKINEIQIKSFDIDSSSIINEAENIIEIKFASFGNKDSDDDVLIKGCFAKSIQERGPLSQTNRKIAALWQHDLSDPIGRIISIEEREDGAYAKIKLSDFDSVPSSKRAYAQIKDGTINQCSFGFYYIGDKMEYDESTESWLIKEVKLYEISIVTLGANEKTSTSAMDLNSIESQLSTLKKQDPEKYSRIQNMIKEEAEPQQALTSGVSIFQQFSNLN